VVKETFKLVEALDRSVSKLKKQNDKYGDTMVEKDRQLKLAQQKIAQLQAAAAAAATVTGDVEGQLATARAELEKLETKVRATTDELNLAQAAKQEACASKEALGQLCTRKDEKVTSLENALQQLNTVTEQKSAQIAELVGSSEQAVSTESDLNGKLNKLEVQVRNLAKEKGKLEAEKALLNSNLEAMEQQKTEVNSKLQILIKGIEKHLAASEGNFMAKLEQNQEQQFGTKKKKPMKFDKAWFTYKRIMKPNNVRKMVAAFGKSVRKKR